MFVITLLYSVVQPLIVIFGAIYFGVAYVVYKYKLLFGEQRRDLLTFDVLSHSLQSSINPTNLKVKPGRLPSFA